MAEKPLPSNFELYAHEQSYDTWARETLLSDSDLYWRAASRVKGRPGAVWIGEWGNAEETARTVASEAAKQGRLFVLVLYNIPQRDLGWHSAGGAGNDRQYRAWVSRIARAVASISGARGMFIVEPDALALSLSPSVTVSERQARLELLVDTCRTLQHACPASYVYLDVGHPRWHPAGIIASRLSAMKIWKVADGFSLNVSNFVSTELCHAYGIDIGVECSRKIPFVIDTSRNGAGPPVDTGNVINPKSARLGAPSNTRIAKEENGYCERLHAVLWIKIPGESDGNDSEAPAAGQFWPQGMLRLLSPH